MSHSIEMDLEFDPFSAEMMEDPYDKYRLLRQHAPVYYNKTRGFWAVTRYAEGRTVFKDYERFSNKDGAALDGVSKDPRFFGTTMVIMDPPDHTKLRRQFNPGWTVHEMAKLSDVVQGFTDDLIDAFAEEGEADFAHDFCWALPIETISHIVGVPKSDRPWLRERFHVAFKRGAGVVGLPPAAIDAAAELRGYFGERVAERRKDPQDDLLTFIASMQNLDGGGMTDAEVEGYCLMLYSAGVFTTACFLSNSLLALSREHDQRKRMIDDPEVMPAAIEELLRYESPIQQFLRTTLHDTELGGVQISEGDRVAVFPGSANRDEEVWGDTSEQLDIDRKRVKMLSFGDGVHTCLGSHLARLEGRIGLAAILARIPEYEVAGPLVRTDRVNERGLTSMPVRF
jgi:cytochrome P450